MLEIFLKIYFAYLWYYTCSFSSVVLQLDLLQVQTESFNWAADLQRNGPVQAKRHPRQACLNEQPSWRRCCQTQLQIPGTSQPRLPTGGRGWRHRQELLIKNSSLFIMIYACLTEPGTEKRGVENSFISAHCVYVCESYVYAALCLCGLGWQVGDS